MFMQVMHGKCTRHDELRDLTASWSAELKPGAPGWLGGTYGFTDDDEFFGIVRFATLEDAMANSARPEQAEFSERLSALFDGPIEFHDYTDVTPFLDGDSDDAGFVQIIQGRLEDRSLVDELVATTDRLHELRPEVIGGRFAVADDGTFIETVAFTDEATAREAEAGMTPPPEMAAVLEKVMDGATFHDLHDPWFEGPR